MREGKAPKDLPVVIFSKGRFLAEVWVKSSARPSLLGEITTTIGRHNILIKNIMAYTAGNVGNAFILIDCTNMTCRAEDLIRDLRSIDGVTDVAFFAPSHYGYVYEVFGFPLTTSNKEEVMIMRTKSFTRMLDGIRAYFGSAGDAFLWYLAREGGANTAEWFIEELEGLGVVDRIKFHLDTLFSVGWGRFELAKFDEESRVIEIVVKDCLEVLHSKGAYSEPRCIFIRGYLTGALSKYLNRDIRLEEVKCEGKGDPYCLFIGHF